MRLILRPERFGRPFPTEKRVEVRAGRGLAAAWTVWRKQTPQPLRVTARLASPISLGVDDAIHLDSVLSFAALDAHGPYLVHEPLPPLDRCVTPLPLGLVWTSPEGWPLWAAADMTPVGVVAQDVVYVHRRYPDHREPLQRERGANTSAGRWKDVRIPQRVTVCDGVEGLAFGDAEAVADLLTRASHLGKKAAYGRGRVVAWDVTPAPEVTLDDVMQRRAVPTAALGEEASLEPERLGRGTYTPPYWDQQRALPIRTARHG